MLTRSILTMVRLTSNRTTGRKEC